MIKLGIYLLVAYLNDLHKGKPSVYEIIQKISVSALDKSLIRELIIENKIISNQNFKEYYPSLFDDLKNLML